MSFLPSSKEWSKIFGSFRCIWQNGVKASAFDFRSSKSCQWTDGPPKAAQLFRWTRWTPDAEKTAQKTTGDFEAKGK